MTIMNVSARQASSLYATDGLWNLQVLGGSGGPPGVLACLVTP